MKVFLLLFVLSVPAQALVHAPWPDTGSEAPQTRPWIHAMEASMQSPLHSPTYSPFPWSTWLGWMMTIGFFAYLLNLHVKMKRREQSLLRGGDRDFVLIPPSRKKRS